ncbi:MAG: serine/threonine-protein kinase [Burkholderiales bacterium]
MSARPLFEADPAPLVEQLGKYRIVRVLGEGAMGIVYEAIDPQIDRRVAVKAIRAPLLRAGAADEMLATARFRTEAQAAGRLSHPNIVSIYEYGEAGDDRFIAMEYVRGMSLHELTARGRRLPTADVASLMTQLLDALECAHDQGVWHRDIKPANLLVTAEGRLKVTDFGIARIESSNLTLPSSVLGSSGYMAPERYHATEAPDCRVDIFSCGVLLYELLTGRQPYRGSNSEVMYQVLHDDPPPPSTLPIPQPPPAAFDAVVARAMARDRQQRFASAAQMRDALREAAGGPIAPLVSAAAMRRLQPVSGAAPTERQARPLPSAAPAIQPPAPTTGEPLLGALRSLLAVHIGPVARIVVRDAARRSVDARALIAQIANEVLDAGDRAEFTRSALRLLQADHARRPPPASAPSVPPSALPVLGSTPITPAVVDRARALLAEQIGPIAGLLVRRAAAKATSREQFFATLVDQTGADTDHKRLLAQLWRIVA